MKVEEAKALLQAAQLAISTEARLRNDTGTQLKLDNGAIVNVFDSGNFNVQGKNQKVVTAALGAPAPSAAAAANTKVFVVYGHDKQARNELEVMLRRWGLDPLILDQLPSEGQTVIEKLEKYTTEGRDLNADFTDGSGGQACRSAEALAVRAVTRFELGKILSFATLHGVTTQEPSQGGRAWN